MSSSSPLFFLFSFALVFLQGALGGEIVCEDLPTEVCSFSIASSGKRCLLENTFNYEEEKQCTTSQVMVERGMSGYIETDECVKACGVDRNSVGISSDTLLDAKSVSNICSAPCYQNCPNIIDLYFNLAAAEGVVLGDLCEKQRSHPHRAMIQLLSSGDVEASSPIGSQTQNFGGLAAAPALAPASI